MRPHPRWAKRPDGGSVEVCTEPGFQAGAGCSADPLDECAAGLGRARRTPRELREHSARQSTVELCAQSTGQSTVCLCSVSALSVLDSAQTATVGAADDGCARAARACVRSGERRPQVPGALRGERQGRVRRPAGGRQPDAGLRHGLRVLLRVRRRGQGHVPAGDAAGRRRPPRRSRRRRRRSTAPTRTAARTASAPAAATSPSPARQSYRVGPQVGPT